MSDNEKEDLGKPPPRWLLKALTRVNVLRLSRQRRTLDEQARPVIRSAWSP